MGAAREADLLLGRQSRRGLAAPLRDAVEHGWPQPLELEEHSTPPWPMPTRRAPRTCPSPSSAAIWARPAQGQSRSIASPAPSPARCWPRCRRSARTWRSSMPSGPTRRQCPARGHHRRPEGGGAGRQALDRHGGGDRRRFAGAPPNACILPLGPSAHRPGAGRRPSLLRPGLLQARQRLLQSLGRHRARARDFLAWMQENVLARSPNLPSSGAPMRRRGRKPWPSSYPADRDHDRRRGPALTNERRLLRRHRRALGRLQSGAAHPRARHHADLRVRHHRRQAGRAAAVDRRRRAVGDGDDGGLDPRDVPLLAAGRPHPIGFLGAAQIDRFANINTTVIGDYAKPKMRLPGGGGAPEIATSCEEIFIIMLRMRQRAFVESSISSPRSAMARAARTAPRPASRPGADQRDHRSRHPRAGPREPELTLTSLHPGVAREQIARPLRLEPSDSRPRSTETPPPTAESSPPSAT